MVGQNPGAEEVELWPLKRFSSYDDSYILYPEQLRGVAGTVVEGALQFHKQCGKLIKISSDCQRARRLK